MVAFEFNLFSFLTVTASAVKAIISDRMYPLRAPDKSTYPLITYSKIDGERDSTHDGNSGLANPSMRLKCWSPSYLTAKNLALEVVKALNGRTGAMGGTDRSGSMVEDEVDLFDPETKLYHIVVDVAFWHSEDT